MDHLVLKLKKTLYPVFNIFSGILIRLLNPFKKGDFIEINGQLGSVEHKGYQKTILKNIEGEEIQVANTLFYTKHLYNLTHKNIVHLDFQVSVAYSENMGRVKSLISEYLERNNTILKSPSAKIFVKKIKNNHVELGIKAWCTIENYLEADAETEMFLNEYLISKGISLEDNKSAVKQLMMA